MDAGEEVFDYVLELALAFDDVADGLGGFFFGGALDEDDGVALGDVVEVEALGSFCLDADAVDGEVEEVSDAGAHVTCDGGDFWRGEDECCVDVDDGVAGVGELFEREVEEDGGVGVLPAWVARREEAADVACGDCAEDGVGDGVEEDVAIGMTGEAFRVVKRHAADAERNPGFECVRVPAESDASVHDASRPLGG